MDALRADADALHAQIVVRMERNENDGGEAEYLPDESRAIRHLFIRYMGYRKDLLHLARVYIGFKKVQGDACAIGVSWSGTGRRPWRWKRG